MNYISKYGLIIIAILLATVYWPTFVWMNARFTEAETYYSHGVLVPFVSAYLIWLKREELQKCAVKPIDLALLIFVPALLIHLFAYFFEINFVSGFTLIAALFGLALYLYGPDITKKAAFPVIFLVFMVPLPQVLIINISFKMKMMAAQAAASIINLMGIPAIRDGSIVRLKPDVSLTIGSPCSGLSSLIALTALGALYAYLARMSGTRKIILFLLSIPIALAANIFRITLLLLVGFAYDAKIATGPFVHGFLAFLLYVFAIAGLIIVGRMLSWGKKELNLIIAIVILAACGACVLAISAVKRSSSRDVKLMGFPLNLGEWTGTDIKFEDKEYQKQVYQILGTDKVLLRSYSDRKNEAVAIQVVYSDRKRQSFHPPEYCYLGSGASELLETGKRRVALDDGKFLTVNRTVYQTRRGKVLMLDWYTAGDLMTGNYYKQQICFVINQLKHARSGGSAVRVWTPIIGNDTETAFDRCQRLIREVVKLLPDYL